MTAKLSVKLPHVLLVEGEDEKSFFSVLLDELNLKDTVQVIPVGGKDQFPRQFPLFLADPEFHNVVSYAIVRDADESSQSAFMSICGLLRKHQQPCPTEVETYSTDERMKVGVYIIPGQDEKGALETLCLESVSSHPAMRCIDDYMNCLRQFLPTDKYPGNIWKARTRAFLAAMHQDTPNLGIAARKHYWDMNHEKVLRLKIFVGELVHK